MRLNTNRFEENFFNKELTRATTNAAERYSGNEEFDKIVELWHKSGIKMSEFAIKPNEENTQGIYPIEEVKKDVEYVKNFENKHNFQETQVNINQAVIAETTFLEGVHEYGWLGDNISANSTTRYDDYKNSIDAFITYDSDNENNDFILGFDITTSSDDAVLDKKIYKNIEKLEHTVSDPSDIKNALHEIKYFENPETEEKQPVYVPRIVLVMNISDTNELMQKLINKDQRIAEDPIKKEIKNQIISQLAIALEQLIRKYIDSDFKNNNNWPEVLENNKDKIDQHPGLNLLLEKYTKPLRHFETI